MENGKNGNKWVRWALGIILVTVLPFIGTTIWSNDKDSRSRDTELKDEFVAVYREQALVTQKILITLAKMETDMIYIKRQLQ